LDYLLIGRKLEKLRTQIKQRQYKRAEEWEGSDVVICSNPSKSQLLWIGEQNLVIRLQDTEPRRRLVVTKYSMELSWLFNELRDIFFKIFDFVNKYDFYGVLAQAALDYIYMNEENEDINGLLSTVLSKARKFLKND